MMVDGRLKRLFARSIEALLSGLFFGLVSLGCAGTFDSIVNSPESPECTSTCHRHGELWPSDTNESTPYEGATDTRSRLADFNQA